MFPSDYAAGGPRADEEMPRTFTALTVQTPDPGAFRERFDALVDGHERIHDHEEATPRDEVEGRLRFELYGAHHDRIGDAIERGDLGPLEWAVVSWTMDEAIGVHADVYDGEERVDRFRGEWVHSGADTEAYLERYHGVRVERAGPYLSSSYYHPSLDLARPEVVPDQTLADDTPTGPFVVEDANDWLVVEASLDDPHAFTEGVAVGPAFVDWFRDRLREEGLVLGPREDLVDRPWVTDGPTDLVRDRPTEDEPGRIRLRVPLTGVAVNEEGPHLRFGPGSYDGDVEWVVFCYGDHDTGRVDGYVYLADDRFTFEDGLDVVAGDEGRRGADVAAYLRRYYGWRIDPTPAEIETPPETGDLPEGPSRPSDRVARRLRDAGVEPGPEMPAPDE